MKRESFFQKNIWGWRELVQLLLLVLVLVPIFIEIFMQNALMEWFQNNFYAGTLTGFIMSLIFTAGVYFIAIKRKHLSWKEVGLQGFQQSYWAKILGWTVLLVVLSLVMALVMESLFAIGTDNSKTDSLQVRMTPINIWIAFISAAVISPIYEEIFYRGFLYRWIRSKAGVTMGMLVSSFIFMLVHIPTYNTLPYTFVSGLIFAWTYEKTASIYPAMIIHGAFNGLAIILTVLNL